MNDVVQYRNFIESLKSRKTKKLYDFELKQFIQYIKREEHLISDYPKLIETQIIDYICHLKSKGLSQSKLSLALCAISHFYTMNDILLNKKKITKFMNNNDDTVPNKAYNKNNAGYTTEQILKLLDFCDDRIRLIILLFASSGIRLAGLSGLKIRNLSKIKNENIYQITVYQGSKEEYVTFCTPECTKAIDSYLSYRERSGEKLDPNSALIRDQFNADDLIRVKNPKVVTTSTIGKTIDTKLRQAGLRQIEHATENKYASQLRKTIPMIHGFRKTD